LVTTEVGIELRGPAKISRRQVVGQSSDDEGFGSKLQGMRRVLVHGAYPPLTSDREQAPLVGTCIFPDMAIRAGTECECNFLSDAFT
jgi:hypothetical protein